MFPTEATHRETVAALLRIQADLQRTLLRQRETDNEREAWCNAVSTLLLESARGRLFLSRLQPAQPAKGEPERLAG